MTTEINASVQEANAVAAQEDRASITLPFSKGKKAATYSLGDEISLNLALTYEREAADAILSHIADNAEDDTLGGYEFFFPATLDPTELPETGRVVFSGKYDGKGAGKTLVAIMLAYIPPMEQFLASCSEQSRDFFEGKIAELLARMSRSLVDITEDGAKLTGNIPADAFSILAPKPRAVGADKFMPLAVAFTAYLVKAGTGGRIAIPAGDIRRALASAHFVQTSAYADLEKPDSNNPKGLFGTALAKLDKIVASAVNDPAKMQTVVDTFRTLIKTKAVQETITPEFIADMHKAAWCERMAHDRLQAVLKAKTIKKSDAETAGDALLGLLA